MKPIEIEAWALKIVDAVKRNAPHEDSRVECKAEWIAPSAAARRIAAHGNAAGGEPILWLIGLDGQLTAYFRPAGSPLAAAAIGTMIEVGTLDTDCLKAWAVDPRKSDLTLPWPNRQDSEES
jgi:hypothetical protein